MFGCVKDSSWPKFCNPSGRSPQLAKVSTDRLRLFYRNLTLWLKWFLRRDLLIFKLTSFFVQGEASLWNLSRGWDVAGVASSRLSKSIKYSAMTSEWNSSWQLLLVNSKQLWHTFPPPSFLQQVTSHEISQRAFSWSETCLSGYKGDLNIQFKKKKVCP